MGPVPFFTTLGDMTKTVNFGDMIKAARPYRVPGLQKLTTKTRRGNPEDSETHHGRRRAIAAQGTA